jgi:hypothetical protein
VLVVSPLFVLLLFSKTVCVVVLQAQAVQQYKQGAAQHMATKQQSNKPRVGGSWKPY